MKKTGILLLLFCLQSVVAQKHITRSGTTSFKASVAAFEPIEAINKSSSAILTNDGNLAALLLVKGFHFKVALMQEHFNENYMDSDTYPKATFKGKLNSFSIDKLTSTSKFILEGILTIKGISKKITTDAFVVSKNGKIVFTTKFSVTPQEFGIKIPSIVRKKIAKNIHISIHYEFIKN